MSWTFHIGALPRSGSAWIATLMNMHPGVFCFHDALWSFEGKYNEAPKSKAGYDHVGDCSSGVCLFTPPDRVAFVARNTNEVRESLKDVGLDANFESVINVCAAWLDEHCMEGKIISFHSIFSDNDEQCEAALNKLFTLTVPGVKLSMDKVRALRPLKVELLNLGPKFYSNINIEGRMS